MIVWYTFDVCFHCVYSNNITHTFISNATIVSIRQRYVWCLVQFKINFGKIMYGDTLSQKLNDDVMVSENQNVLLEGTMEAKSQQP